MTTAKDAAIKTNMTAGTLQAAIVDMDGWDDKVDLAVAAAKRTKDLRKAARARHASEGVDLEVMDEIREMKKADLADLRQKETTRAQYMVWQGFEPVGTQAEMFAKPSAEEDEARMKHDAMLQGKAAGRRGDPRTANRFEVGTVAYAAFDTGWNEGDTEAFKAADPGRVPKKGKGAESGKAKPVASAPAAEPVVQADTVADPAKPSADMPAIPDEFRRTTAKTGDTVN